MKKSKLLTSLLAVSLMTVGCSSGDKASTKEEPKQETKQETKKNEFKLGDTLTFDKIAEITVKSAEFTDERNPVETENPAKVLIVTYDVKNISDKDMPIGTEITLYEDGVKAENYPLKVTLDGIGAGRKYENATRAFKLKGKGPIELEVAPMFSFSDKKVIKLDIQ